MVQRSSSKMLSPAQQWSEKTKRTPVQHATTRRAENCSVVTSGYGGKFIPLKMIPLLREDGLSSSTLTINTYMAETASMLLNPVRVTATAHLVPKLAFERFQDMGTIHRSYNGQPEIDASVVPWFEEWDYDALGSINELAQTLGLHFGATELYNTDYVEAYNAVWNHIARNRSNSLTLRDNDDDTLAPAFWQHTQLKYMKPNFDDAMIDGEIALNIVDQVVPVKGIGKANQTYAGGPVSVYETGGTGSVSYSGNQAIDGGVANQLFRISEDPENPGFPNIYAELQDNGITVSLANLQLARESAAWARIRQRYQGISEEWMIDQLLSGVRLRDEVLNQPILLDQSETVVGMTQRYATDAGNLEQSVTQGQTSLQLRIGAPPLECGGVVVVAVQCLPEQIYERQRDHYLASMTVEKLPNRTADELDPQPVTLVKNGEVDEAHTLPDDLFAYAPLNHEWQRQSPRIGGKYYRPDPTALWNEDRNRIWTTEVEDPTLGPDFYTSETLTHEVFADQNSDPFEFWLSGTVAISGLTYFGPMIEESNDDYEKVLAQVDLDRLEGDGSDEPV